MMGGGFHGWGIVASAVKGKRRCRMHGGKGSGAPSGNRNAWKHGARSAETRLVQAMIRALQDERDGEV